GLHGLSRRRPPVGPRRGGLLRPHGRGLGRVVSGRARGDGRGAPGHRSPGRRTSRDGDARGDGDPVRRRPGGERRPRARDHPRRSGTTPGHGTRGARDRGRALRRRALGRDGRARLSGPPGRILQRMCCRGWSSDAYWAARMTRELERRGHGVTLACLAGTDARVIDGVRREGVEPVTSLALASGVRPVADSRDLGRLRAMLESADVVHVHRGKEHWLAAVANRLIPTPRPVVRTRHIALAVRPHAANRWLYRRATAFVVTVTEAIRRQYIASELVDSDRVAALPGGADAERYRPLPRD